MHFRFFPRRAQTPATLAVVAAALLSACGAQTDTGRWYNSAQVEAGARVFADNCAVCHGARAEATAEWRTPLDNGKYPPPPLDGSAHAWHHPLAQLQRTVARGGVPLGGWMPGFAGKLDEDQQLAAIAWFQSLWSDEIYAAWEQRGGAGG